MERSRRPLVNMHGWNSRGRGMSYQIVTANRLIDGAVVYLTDRNEWSVDIQDSVRAEGDSAESLEFADQLLKISVDAVDTQKIVDPYLIEAVMRNGRICPVKYREEIRSSGPTSYGSQEHSSEQKAA